MKGVLFMKHLNIDGVEVCFPTGMKSKEALSYVKHCKLGLKKYESLSELTIKLLDDGNVSLDYNVQQPKFQRIRRITGYLVGTLDRFNNAKRAEEHDRVKHGI